MLTQLTETETALVTASSEPVKITSIGRANGKRTCALRRRAAPMKTASATAFSTSRTERPPGPAGRANGRSAAAATR